MKVIIDANILFSAILNTESRIGNLILNGESSFSFVAPGFLKEEILQKHEKIKKVSGLSDAQLEESKNQLYAFIHFLPAEFVSFDNWKTAFELTHDIDPKDTPYIAFALQLECSIWSGDKALINGLYKKGFYRFHTTDELFRIRAKNQE